MAAIERVVALGRGDLVDELALTLADVRSGTVLTTALVHLEDRVASLHVTRLSEGIVAHDDLLLQDGDLVHLMAPVDRLGEIERILDQPVRTVEEEE